MNVTIPLKLFWEFYNGRLHYHNLSVLTLCCRSHYVSTIGTKMNEQLNETMRTMRYSTSVYVVSVRSSASL